MDALRAEPFHFNFEIIAHQVEFMSVVCLGRVEGRLGRRKAEDQPSITSVRKRESQDVAKKSAIGLRILALDDYVRTIDHKRRYSLPEL